MLRTILRAIPRYAALLFLSAPLCAQQGVRADGRNDDGKARGGALISRGAPVRLSALPDTTVTAARAAAFTAPRAPASVLSSLLCILTTVTGGDPPIRFIVKLSGPAPSRGASVHVISTNSSVATLASVQIQKDESLLIPGGQSEIVFQVATRSVSNPTAVTIEASYGGITKTVTLTVLPPTLALLETSSSSVAAGTPLTGKVYLTGRIAAGSSIAIVLSSNNSAIVVPAVLRIRADEPWNPANFQIATVPASTSASGAVTATYGGVTRTVTIKVLANGKDTTFNPRVHGLHFQNTDFPGDILIDVPGIGTVNFGHTSYALCGGMSYAALDTYNLGGRAPLDTTPPSAGTPNRSYIYRRQQDSFRYDNGFIIARMAEWMLYPDNTQGVKGVHVLTHHEFLHNIRPELDAGRPVLIGIVKIHLDSPSGVKNALTGNHQSLAIGYSHHEGIDEPHWDVYIYDPNFPDETQTLHTATDHHAAYQTRRGSTLHTDTFRGFFKLPYTAGRPPWIPARAGKIENER